MNRVLMFMLRYMNKFVKGAKNLALALSFVSVCACNRGGEKENSNGVSEEIKDLENRLSKIEGKATKKVEGGKVEIDFYSKSEVDGLITASEGRMKGEVKKDFLDCFISNGIADLSSIDTFGLNLECVEFIVDKDYNIKLGEKEVFNMKQKGILSFLDYVVVIVKRKGILNLGGIKKKIDIKVGDNNEFNIGSCKTNGSGIIFNTICSFGILGEKIVKSLFDWKFVEIKKEGLVFNTDKVLSLKDFGYTVGKDGNSLEIKPKYDSFFGGISILSNLKGCKAFFVDSTSGIIAADQNTKNSSSIGVGDVEGTNGKKTVCCIVG